MESIASVLLLLVAGGIYYPVISASFGLVTFIGRFVYALGYSSLGPKGRLIGAVLSNIGLFGTLGLSITTAILFIQGKLPIEYM